MFIVSFSTRRITETADQQAWVGVVGLSCITDWLYVVRTEDPEISRSVKIVAKKVWVADTCQDFTINV